MRWGTFFSFLVCITSSIVAQNVQTATNGLYHSPTSGTAERVVGLGGTLIQNTIIDLGTGFTLKKSSADYFTILNNGYVGIGTNNPQTSLTVNSAESSPIASVAHLTAAQPRVTGSATITFGESMYMTWKMAGVGGGAFDGGGTWGAVLRFFTNDGTTSTSLVERMKIDKEGNVGIAVTNIPVDYKLAVGGNIIAEKIKVKLQSTGWPDYVFKLTYKLPSLTELEKYLLKNQHLPDVPTATEVEKNGIDLGDNQTILLKKE